MALRLSLRGDFLVIGGGITGLCAALSLAEAGGVIVLTKAELHESNTGYAQGGIAAAIGPDDSPKLHAQTPSPPATPTPLRVCPLMPVESPRLHLVG